MIRRAEGKGIFLGIPPPGGNISVILLVDDSINPCSFNLAVLHFVRPGHSFHHPYVHPELSCVWLVLSSRGIWYWLVVSPRDSPGTAVYSELLLVGRFVVFYCCVLTKTQYLNSLLSSGVSVSIGLVGVGLVSLCWVLPSQTLLLPSTGKGQH